METKVTKRLTTILDNYQKYKIDSREGGWPDHLVQITNHRCVMIESKEIETNKNGQFLLSEFRADQAAFMFKWQRAGGLCFLFLGFKDSNYIGSVICHESRNWLTVRKRIWRPGDLAIFTDNDNDFYKWFQNYIQYACQKP